jgi:hypothetical protein
MKTNPISSPILISPPTEELQTIIDIIIDLVKNRLDITNSVELSKKIIDILTDNDRNNDQIVCDLGPYQRETNEQFTRNNKLLIVHIYVLANCFKIRSKTILT